MTKQYAHQERGSPFSFGDGRNKITWLLANPLERILAALINCLCSAIAFLPLGWAMYDSIFKNFDISLDVIINRFTDFLIQVLPISNLSKIGLVVFVIYLIIQAIMMTFGGQSIGKKIVGIKVVTLKGEETGFFHAVLLRKFIYNLIWITLIGVVLTVLGLRDNFTSLHLVWIPYLICLGMLTDEEDNCRTLQDKLAGTVVVKQDPIVRPH